MSKIKSCQGEVLDQEEGCGPEARAQEAVASIGCSWMPGDQRIGAAQGRHRDFGEESRGRGRRGSSRLVAKRGWRCLERNNGSLLEVNIFLLVNHHRISGLNLNLLVESIRSRLPIKCIIEQVRDDDSFHTTCGTPNYVAPDVLNDRGYDGAIADL
ncbi:hypothetical protein ZIOFF_067706 [Zingiber officinale]|uniref:Uncharacterized protein n=1 Tax=Zingiber officinale TaxID=94328 RepID=A0A8J5CFY7_ZINOF|nr:hypothetical protein ZIOFF_067706 [Zingiber officinale]